MKIKDNIVIISGPSGVGKGTVINSLIAEIETFSLAVSATTRKKRNNEIDNVDYYFFDTETFDKMINNNEFIEYCEVHGNKYGTLYSEIKKINNSGKICLLEIDTQGAQKVKKKIDNAVMVFLKPPSIEALKKRLLKRGTDNEMVIENRLRNAQKEIDQIEHYDFVVVNDNISDTVKNIKMFFEQHFSNEV